ncbi:hypothetical protein [Bifidobacterium aesculapii]|uniref:hypothetical protein n=1 Tax=Bifidobacterium aesculapii TaxID=1329411 RepID=UPI00128F1E76|nr:hypothetical protein [Bifidobacterium aesculapii]
MLCATVVLPVPAWWALRWLLRRHRRVRDASMMATGLLLACPAVDVLIAWAVSGDVYEPLLFAAVVWLFAGARMTVEGMDASDGGRHGRSTRK